jgi:XTP/dITP diphosphohydrolase
MSKEQELPDYLQAFDRLVHIMDDLREKCPWDREQTFESLRKLTIEEAYELAEAIVKKDMEEIRTETGDLLLHIVFYAKLAREENAFTLAEMINTLCEKLIYRHPHVFGETEASTAEQVLENWEDLKLKENNHKNRSVLSGVPATLPALTKAMRIQEKVSGIGFDWEKKEEIWDKLDEEVREVKEVLAETPERQDRQKLEEEFGDLLFTVVNAARLYGVEPEIALERSNLKFISRFQEMEERIKENGKTLKESTLGEMEKEWNKAKENDERS